MSRGVTRLSTGSDGSRRKCCLQWCGGRLKLSGTNFLLAPRRGELGWAGVCVSSHEGDDVCVYVAIVAMSLQYLHEPQCHSLVQVFLSLAVCGSVHNLLMVLSSGYRDLQLTAGLAGMHYAGLCVAMRSVRGDIAAQNQLCRPGCWLGLAVTHTELCIGVRYLCFPGLHC